MTNTNLEEVYFIIVMTEVRVSERSGLDTIDPADGSSDGAMDMAMEMATAVTSIPALTAGEDNLEPMGINENGKQRRMSEAPETAMALGDRRSHMDSAALQQTRKLAQLHRTIAKLANMLEMQSALREALWQRMKTWLEEK